MEHPHGFLLPDSEGCNVTRYLIDGCLDFPLRGGEYHQPNRVEDHLGNISLGNTGRKFPYWAHLGRKSHLKYGLHHSMDGVLGWIKSEKGNQVSELFSLLPDGM